MSLNLGGLIYRQAGMAPRAHTSTKAQQLPLVYSSIIKYQIKLKLNKNVEKKGLVFV